MARDICFGAGWGQVPQRGKSLFAKFTDRQELQYGDRAPFKLEIVVYLPPKASPDEIKQRNNFPSRLTAGACLKLAKHHEGVDVAERRVKECFRKPTDDLKSERLP